MTDLEILDVLEQIKQSQKSKKGEKGEPGRGILSIEQFDEESFTIKLDDGSFKRIVLPRGADGEVGATGPAGAKGEPGAPGRTGQPGSDGANGRDGKNGARGVSVDSGVVNPDGQLLLGLSDGSSINLGNVRGPAGATGERGPTGLPGAAGKDGSAVLSGPRTPTQDDGNEGDFWIDISSAEFSFYKKSGTGWSMLANLRQPGKNPAVAVPVGGGGGGGGAGSTTYGSAFPAFAKVGAQHVMDDTLYEYVYTGGAWMQIVSPGGGGGGGATTLGELVDVTLTGTQEGEVLAATNSGTWENSQNIEGGTF